MNGQRAATGFAAMVLMASSAWAQDPGCQHNRDRVGACYAVQGTYQLSADRGFILTREDTGRALIVRPAPHSHGDGPAGLVRAMDKAQRQTGWVSAWVHGDFLVCPVPVDQDGSDNVCIERASNLTTEPPNDR